MLQIAQLISIMTENLNMNMESEYADLLDRKLISLYGLKGAKATKMDQAGATSQAIIQSNQS